MKKLSTKEYKEKINVKLKSKNKIENKFSNKFENKCKKENKIRNRIKKRLHNIFKNKFENKLKIKSKNEEDNIYDSDMEVASDNKTEPYTVFEFAIDVIKYTVIIFAFTSLFTNFIMQRTVISGWSMENSIYEGDNLIVEKVSHHLNELERFDIVAFYPNGKKHEEYYIKRIIGLPGEHIQILENDIYINGTLLEEDYGKLDLIGYAGIAKDGIYLQEEEYFVMGDNRIESYDSRYEAHGPIDLDKIEGKAIFRIWPINRFGPLD